MTPLARDLSLIGYSLDHQTEGCAHATCVYLDYNFDVDAIATGPTGDSTLVSHRDQSGGRWDMDTVTIRETKDNGSHNTQLAKIYDGRSKAGLYVNGYLSGVAYITSGSLLDALQTRLFEDCPRNHPAPGHICIGNHRGHQPCGDGQTMAILCPDCADVIYLRRSVA